MLVVFGDNVLIFSVKYIQFNQSIDIERAWSRWYKRAIRRSADQLIGAENWIRRYPQRIYLDPHCQHNFPIFIPDSSRIRVHRVVVALGVSDACSAYFGGNSLGSLVIQSDLEGDSHYLHPFRIGHVNPTKGFVHVFDDVTLDKVLGELDTISDFVTYISKREAFLSRKKPVVVAAGEEQLISVYATQLNANGEHDFVLPVEAGEAPDGVYIAEDFWDDMIHHPQYIAKKEADKISYVWDRLIEHFIKYGGIHDETGHRHQTASDLEPGLRFMASEPRVRRRQLGYALVHLLETAPQDLRATRVVYSDDFPEKAYLFLVLPPIENVQYDEYREFRRALLLAYCKVAKLLCSNASFIIGIATENSRAKETSEDLVALDVRDWTKARQEEAQQIQKEASLLLDENIHMTKGRTPEWPEVLKPPAAFPSGVNFNRKQRRALESKRRHHRK